MDKGYKKLIVWQKADELAKQVYLETRKFPKGFFVSIALGSCAELETHITIAKELNYIEKSTEESLLELLNYICAMIVNLDKKL